MSNKYTKKTLTKNKIIGNVGEQKQKHIRNF